MQTERRFIALILALILLPLSAHAQKAKSPLENALGNMYAACLFNSVENNPFSQSVDLARNILAPGISGFIESNLASIPLTPPNVRPVFQDGEIVNVVTGFTPIFTESSGTVGQGLFFVGTNFSYFDLSQIRGEALEDIAFAFQQNSGADIISVTMPLNITAGVFTLYGTYGITNRLDIGVAIPVVNLSIENAGTTFVVQGNESGCRYDVGEGGQGLNCIGAGGDEARDITVDLNGFFAEETMESETYLSTIAVRSKYRFPVSSEAGRLAAVLDLRLPLGRTEDNMLGENNFGARLTFVGEYNGLSSLTPYLNVGAQFWNGDPNNNLRLAAGFNQQITSTVFFAFDLLAKLDLESDGFLFGLDDELGEDATAAERALVGTTIPSVEYDHTLNAGLGAQWAITPSFQIYGSALFALLSRGLQAQIAPTVGAAIHF